MCSSGDASRLVLVVEDDPQIQELVALVLADEHLPAAQAGTARAALAVISEQRPAIMLLDLGLPDIATTPLAAVLGAARRAGTRVIVCSAAGRSGGELSGLAAADAYIAKPFDIDELTRVVRRLLDEPEPSPA